MTAVLIANIGNRDVWVAKDAPIPGDVHPAWNSDACLRSLGKSLRERWPEVRSHLRLPIIAKAFDHVREEAGEVDHVILIASDQAGDDGVSQRHLAQDTCEMAPIVERLLVERHGLDAQAVEQRVVRSNPADYQTMQLFFKELLPDVNDAHPEGTFYLEVSGGTPAMTSMLLTVGARMFGVAARPLYVSPAYEEPFPLDLGRRTVAESLQRVVRENTAIYAYHAAADTVRGNLALLQDFSAVHTLLPLLEYGRYRLNFNFAEARAALGDVPSDIALPEVDRLQREPRAGEPWWLLHEIVHNAELRLRVGDYGDFLVRLFRFDEAAHRYAALDLGARFVDWEREPDPNGEVVDPAWLQRKPGLEDYFKKKDVRRTGDGRVKATRFVLSLLVAFLADEQDKSAPRKLLKTLGKINQLSAVRNSSFATHTFDGVTVERMATAFSGCPNAPGDEEALDTIMSTVEEACELATGRPMAPVNPYDKLNDVVCRVLAV